MKSQRKTDRLPCYSVGDIVECVSIVVMALGAIVGSVLLIASLGGCGGTQDEGVEPCSGSNWTIQTDWGHCPVCPEPNGDDGGYAGAVERLRDRVRQLEGELVLAQNAIRSCGVELTACTYSVEIAGVTIEECSATVESTGVALEQCNVGFGLCTEDIQACEGDLSECQSGHDECEDELSSCVCHLNRPGRRWGWWKSLKCEGDVER